jgi:hypothetical protein
MNPVAVTFDDAFASLVDTAIPELKCGDPFTVFCQRHSLANRQVDRRKRNKIFCRK